MNEADRQRLEEKKKFLQTQLKIKNQSKHIADWWLPRLQLIQQNGIEWQLEYFTCAPDDLLPFWQAELQEAPWRSIGPEKLVIKPHEFLYVHNSVGEYFPNHHPLRYLPQLSFTPDQIGATDQEVLQEAFRRLSLDDGPVYFFFTRLQPVLILRFSDLIHLAGKGLFDVIENICITPANYSWLIFRSLEEEWQFGFK